MAEFLPMLVKPEEDEEEAVFRLKEEVMEEALRVAPEDPLVPLPPFPLPHGRQEAAAGCAAPSAGFSAAARRKSKVWNYYSKLGDAFVECNVCRKQLSFHNSTTTMREHLARKHGIRDAPEPALHPEPPRRGRKTPDGAFSRGEALGELLLGMVCRDLQPLATVKDEGFGRLVTFLEPGLSLPALSHLGGLLRCRYVAARSRLQRLLQGAAGSVVLSVEPWAPAPHRRYISVAAHWVDGEWRRIRCLLATQPVPTGAACGEELRSILGSFGVEPAAVLCVVQRDAGDEDGAAAQQEGGWRRLRCAAHGLQRSVAAGLAQEAAQEVLSAARRVVATLQREGSCGGAAGSSLLGKVEAEVAPDVPGRWLSTAVMCERLLQMKWAVLAALEKRRNDGSTGLTEQQWRFLQELGAVLQPLKLLVDFLSEEPNTSASALLPCIHGAAAAIGAAAEGSSSGVQAVAGSIRAELRFRWGLAMGEEEAGEDKEVTLSDPAVLAAFLDPRFKELRFLHPQLRVELHRRVKEMLTRICQTQPLAGGPCGASEAGCGADKEAAAAQSVYDALLGKDPAENMPELHQQLENYIVEPLCRRSTDPLHWWKSNERRFPAVAKLSRSFLALPATVVPPQRAFGAGTDLLEQRRAGLEPEFLDQILFLHHNAEFLEDRQGNLR